MGADCRIIVMAKEPVAARVKTRLCPPLSFVEAAACHEAFVADTLARLRRAVPTADAVLAVTPSRSEAPKLTALARAHGWRTTDQSTGDLGERMRQLLEVGVAERSRVVLIGADTPDLPLAHVRAAFAALAEKRVVLGPATDGGYYLVGCREPTPRIFGPGIAWGTPAVWRETLARMERDETESSLFVLPAWPDVDDWHGLVALSARLDRRAPRDRVEDLNESPPTATRDLLARLRAENAPL